MNICKNCGRDIPNDDQKFCPNCGTPVQNETPAYTNYGTSYDVGTSIQHDHPMKWFKFLIYFALYASAVLNVINGIQYLTGGIWEQLSGGDITSKFMYRAYDGLQMVDMIFGAGLIGVAVLAVLTRNKLAAYKSDGPDFVTKLYTAAAALPILYSVLVTIVCDLSFGDVFTSSTFTSIAVSIAMIFANKKYFDNRSDLFVN